MTFNLTLSFIRKKLQELQNALFFPISDSVLKMPVCVITVITVDEIGQIWFAVSRPAQQIHEFDREFPARMDFFKKGKEFYLKILGKAYIVTDPEEVNSAFSIPAEIKEKAMSNELALLKVKITHADYFESAPVKKKGTLLEKLKNIRLSLFKWAFPEYPAYHLSLSMEEVPARGAFNAPGAFNI